MLIVDTNTLGFVYLLYFVYEVPLGSFDTQDVQDVVGVDGAGRDTAALFDEVTFMYDEVRTERDGVAPFFTVLGSDMDDVDIVMVFFFGNRYGTADFRDDSIALRLTGFKQFFDTRKTLGDITGRCDTARMEGTHGQLCARFTDGLSSDGADRFADIDLAAGTEVAAIALRADTVTAVAGKDAADPNGIVIFCNFFRLVGHDFLIEGHDDGTRFRIDQGFSSRTAFDPFFERFDDAVAFDDGRDFYAADIVVAGFDFFDITVQDAIDGIFRKGRTLGADFNAIGIDNASSMVLPSMFSAMDLRIAARKPSSGAPRETVSMTFV